MPRRELVKPFTRKGYRAYLRRLVPKGTKVWLIVISYPDDDHQFGYSPGGQRETLIGRKEIIGHAVDYYMNEGLTCRTRDTYAPRPPMNLAEVLEDVRQQNGADSEWGTCHTESAKDHAKRQEEELRQRGERTAAMICSKYKVKGGTLQFIHAAKKHFNRTIEAERHFRDDGESRMERWAMCMYGGAGSEGFFSDNDYASSKIAEAQDGLEDLLAYLERFCPLLMARYNEVIERRRQAKREGNNGST